MRGFPVGAIPISEEANIWSIFIAEIILTFAMNFVTVAALLDDKYSHPLTPYVIGMTVFQGVLAGWHVGAGCMNPARVFAPAVIASGKSIWALELHFDHKIQNGMRIGFGGLVKLSVLVLQSSSNAWCLLLFTLAAKMIQTVQSGGGEFISCTRIQIEKSISEERISLHGQLHSISTRIQIEKCTMLKLLLSYLHHKSFCDWTLQFAIKHIIIMLIFL